MSRRSEAPPPDAPLADADYRQPTLPYRETQGWSGTDTSRERAEREAADGTARDRQSRTLALLEDAGLRGLTWHELSDATGWHHGQSSGVLSVLHKAERIARLHEKRNRCHPYVLPEFIAHRDTESQRGSIAFGT